MPECAATLAVAARLSRHFRAAGAVPVHADILQPAETLLDLYGEDIRARAYVTRDPLAGEMMLRPDFTVPVVQAHMTNGAEPARYTYEGPVFRKQEAPGARAREYLQVGYELFDRTDPALADAEVFALIASALDGLPLRPVTGDIGLLRAAVAGLSLTDHRRAALMRHIWRPARFRALIERFTGRGPLAEARAALTDRLRAASAEALIAEAGPVIGLRSADEITDRVATLLADAETPPLPAAEVALMNAILSVAMPSRAALEHLRALDWSALAPALERLARRLDALDARGIDTATLPFEASFGRSSMEYYDGFVFGFVAEGAGLPPVATGGRYDALTSVLGQGRAIPAVGGVIRPALVAALEGAQ
ncbi:ATP phosphoribosyltransferase regulatory subunit [Rhodobacteraceae bacterium 2376]|uniref:ATP phosphoribosyltransferase regulatory subunit n=1 Tax=Rhabdonatronobacter sediminivivens TaxID=2743469 RepID=A0A7Z0I1Z7_9RHOB|nr:ATP phosphoribosyltransferase regulatory subunit [Rhabdonatronobacter sediminivivens]NYS26458.1 ATP phosphoribosyltransferase regulatory subunit [Rhabdonatronobacter sediminivivens]